jgi:hypothetical protein
VRAFNCCSNSPVAGVDDVDQGDEVDAALVEAVPAVAPGVRRETGKVGVRVRAVDDV